MEGRLNGQRRSVRLALIWGVWTLIGLFFTSQIYFSPFYTQGHVSLSNALFSQLTYCYLAALVTPLILWLTRRFRIERQNWPARILLHFLAGLLIVSVVSGVDFSIYMIYMARPGYITANSIFQYIFFNLDKGMYMYWLIVLISHALNYYHRLQKGELKSSQLEVQLAQAQLQALKMQLHPHFLFNTLHSISALLNKDAERARKMITLLGDFLRLTLENAGTQEVTLQQEIEFLRGYLEIEKIRFQNRLAIRIEVESAALGERVPNLILQPIVENAIRHAIAPRSGPGRIEITARPKDEMLTIQVKDTGPGLPLDKSLADYFDQGVGLANTRERLKRLYGDRQRFELNNDPAGGLIVTIEIPSVSKWDQSILEYEVETPGLGQGVVGLAGAK